MVMKMGQGGVTRISNSPKHPALPYSISSFHAYRAALHVTQVAVIVISVVQRHLIARVGRWVGHIFVQLGIDCARSGLIGDVVTGVLQLHRQGL